MTVRLVVRDGLTDKKEYELQAGKTYFIGRSRQADIIVKDQQASRRHCAIEATPDGTWTVADQDSSNGTYVNRQRTKSRVLKDGDIVQVGHTTFEVRLPQAPAEPKPEPQPPDSGTVIVGSDGELRAKSTVKEEPPGAAEPPKPQPAAAEPKPEAQPKPAAKQAGTDEDLQDLFAFLDKIEADERPARAEQPQRGSEERSVPHEPPPVTPPPAKAEEKEPSKGPLFDLLDKAEPIPKSEEPQPEPKKKGGGLLGFLRRKKKRET